MYFVGCIVYVVFKVARVCSIALANRSISELIHLARWVKFNPRFIPGLALIGVCGTEFNRGLNFNPGLGNSSFNPGSALIKVLRNGAVANINPKCQPKEVTPPPPPVGYSLYSDGRHMR